jgi:hypothetical protein
LITPVAGGRSEWNRGRRLTQSAAAETPDAPDPTDHDARNSPGSKPARFASHEEPRRLAQGGKGCKRVGGGPRATPAAATRRPARRGIEWMREHYRAKGETPRESQSRGQLAGMMSIRSRFWVRPQQSIDARTSPVRLAGRRRRARQLMVTSS